MSKPKEPEHTASYEYKKLFADFKHISSVVNHLQSECERKDKVIAEHEEAAHTYKREWESAIEREQYKVELLSEKDAQLAKYKAALKKIRAYTGDAHICEITSAALAEGDGV